MSVFLSTCRYSRLAGSGGEGAASQRSVGPGQGHHLAFRQTRSQRLDYRLDAGHPGGAHWYHTSVVLKCFHVADFQVDR